MSTKSYVKMLARAYPSSEYMWVYKIEKRMDKDEYAAGVSVRKLDQCSKSKSVLKEFWYSSEEAAKEDAAKRFLNMHGPID